VIKSKVEVNETSLITAQNLFRVGAESISLCVAVQKEKQSHKALKKNRYSFKDYPLSLVMLDI